MSVDQKVLEKLVHGAQRVFENAVELYKEAVVLRDNGSTSRALFLHQISMEECAKIEVLGASAAGLFMGHKVDLDKMSEVFRSHARKNRVNAYFFGAV